MKTKFVNDPNDKSGEFCGPITKENGCYMLEFKDELFEIPQSFVSIAVVDKASLSSDDSKRRR